jgi:hypothetical protein
MSDVIEADRTMEAWVPARVTRRIPSGDKQFTALAVTVRRTGICQGICMRGHNPLAARLEDPFIRLTAREGKV